MIHWLRARGGCCSNPSGCSAAGENDQGEEEERDMIVSAHDRNLPAAATGYRCTTRRRNLLCNSEMRSKEHRQHTSEKVPFLEPVPAVLRPVSAIFVVFNALDKFFLLRKGPRTAT